MTALSEKPKKKVQWANTQQIQWGCALMELLGETSLELLPLVLSGSRAIESSAQTRQHISAIRRARQLLGKLLTRRAVKLSVIDLNIAYENRHKPGQVKFDLCYDINPKTLAFSRMPSEEARIQAGLEHLSAGPIRQEHSMRYPAPGTTDLVARINAHTAPKEVALRLTGVSQDTPPQHDLDRQPDTHLRVTLHDLEATAHRLDALDDQADGRWPKERWFKRLKEIVHLHRRTPEGLQETDTLDLQGLKHLIGLPGAGKTTLISLICAHLAVENKRVCVFFTSIEMAREYLDRLRRYEIKAAMLVGSSPKTQRKHGERLAELIAVQGDGGFGHTHPGADLFAQTCPLPAFAIDEVTAWKEWTTTEAPCEHIYTPEGKTPHLCPLWSRCGRVKNQRDLVDAHVWLGHIRSADTTVPAHSSSERLQYFELIARTFDLIIVDEVDETQKTLDELGAVALPIGGQHDSVHAHAQQVTNLALTGRLKVHDDGLIYRYQHAANNFERHLLRFHEEVNTFESNHQQNLGLHLQNRLLTTNFLINQAVKLLGISLSASHLSAVYAFWDSAVYTAYFRRNQGDPASPETGTEPRIVTRPWAQISQMAEGLSLSEGETERRWTRLQASLRDYIYSLDFSPDLNAELREIEEQFAALLTRPGTTLTAAQGLKLAPLARLNVAVGFTIAAYQNLVRMTRPLSQYNVLPEAVKTRVSKAMERAVARNLLGTFSSVSYRAKENSEGFDINYLILDTAPRLLLQRLHEQGSNVLLTSATSWMPDSTTFHVSVMPDYVLQPRQHDRLQLRLRYLPSLHPTTREPLRYSGGGRQRDENLRLMVRQLARASIGQSQLEKAARSMSTSRGRQRMCALIVNSYDQVQDVVRQIAQVNPALAANTRGVLRTLPKDLQGDESYILRGQVETLGHDEDVTVVVFPLTALGRGVNIVFNTTDEDNGTAAIGSLYFLTRPHPVIGDLSLMVSNIARETERFDKRRFPQDNLLEVQSQYLHQRGQLYHHTMRLLARNMSASRLPDSFLPAFAANLLIPILQTIGRAIRRSSPAEVYFVDAAWAPRSAEEQADDERSSVLVTMQQLLQRYVTDPDPGESAVMNALYRPFAEAFSDIEGLITGGYTAPDDDDGDYPPVNLEDDGDLYD